MPLPRVLGIALIDKIVERGSVTLRTSLIIADNLLVFHKAILAPSSVISKVKSAQAIITAA
jgi:hypothetical protein